VNLQARWHGVTGTHDARIDDLSVSGCFVASQGAVDEGEIVTLEIKLPSGESLSLRSEVVSYLQLVGFGVSFSSLTEQEQSLLNQLVQGKS
jgi:hypothetical protein